MIELSGRTPLVRLGRLAPAGAQVWAKCEQYNLGGSFKDRVAGAVIERLAIAGLAPGATLVATHAGNLGISLAVVGAARGYRIALIVPDDTSKQRIALLRAYRAEVTAAPAAELEARAAARAADGGHRVDLATDPAAHLGSAAIADEIVDALGPPDAVVIGAGTGISARGLAATLTRRAPECRVVAVLREHDAPDSRDPGAGRIQGLSDDDELFPQLLAIGVHNVRRVGARVAAEIMGRLAHEEGLLAGHSAGATTAIALDLALNGAPVTVAVLADSGERHFAVHERFR